MGHTEDMATVLKEKQMKLATVTKKIDRLIDRLTEAVKHWAEREKVTTEKEEMAGILECPAKQQVKGLANNRFAALSEEEETDCGGKPTMTEDEIDYGGKPTITDNNKPI